MNNLPKDLGDLYFRLRADNEAMRKDIRRYEAEIDARNTIMTEIEGIMNANGYHRVYDGWEQIIENSPKSLSSNGE